VPNKRPHDGLKVDPTVGIRRHQRCRRQPPMRGVRDDPERSDRNPVLERNSRRHVRFHIDRNRTGFFVKLPLGLNRGKRHVGTRNIAE